MVPGASDYVLLVISLAGFLAIGIAIYLILPKAPPGAQDAEEGEDGFNDDDDVNVGALNRAQRRARANQRLRRRRRPRQDDDGGGDGGGEEDGDDVDHHHHDVDEDDEDGDGPAVRHMTRRERQKAAKRAEREERRRYEEQRREDLRQKREAEEEEYQERKAREAEEAERERERADRERREREEREGAEYDEWRGLFSIDGGGIGATSTEEEARLEREVIEYVQEHKVVFLDNLASRFDLSGPDAVERVRSLEREGKITGIIDDRGKFIYIEPDEMSAIADFVRRKGRVTLSELAAKSSELISLRSSPADVVSEDELTILEEDGDGDEDGKNGRR